MPCCSSNECIVERHRPEGSHVLLHIFSKLRLIGWHPDNGLGVSDLQKLHCLQER